MNLFSKILDLLFPLECIICHKSHTDLCPSCIEKLRPAKKSNHDWITSFFDYHDERVETIMRTIKNSPNVRMLEKLVVSIPETSLLPISHPISLPTTHDSLLAPIIIPIPIDKSRFLDRGYNQAELIARTFSRRLSIPLEKNILIKNKRTQKQGTLSKSQRLINMHNAFAVRNPEKIAGRDIILVDDITTTGSTLVEARAKLLEVGAQKVIAITLAN